MNRRDFIKTSAVLSAPLISTGCGGPEPETIPGLPVANFSDSATAADVTEGIDLSGKIAVVTGCNSGLGLETMRVLAMRGAHVLGTGRTLEKAQAACESIDGQATPVVLELSDLQSCVDAAITIREMTDKVDILVANAGLISGDELKVINGMEQTLAINHLGHFVFINRILDQVIASPQGRIVMVGSGASYSSVPEMGIDMNNLDGSKGYKSMEFYGQSKLANSLFALKLADELKDTSVTVNSIGPGFVKTNIGRNTDGLMGFAINTMGKFVAKTTEEGAAVICYVATNPELDQVSGYFIQDLKPLRVEGGYHYDMELANQLWVVSESLAVDYLL
jgi:NAD(P)-dependent dehydrogenase (short-subunit alcohol dehydrogenase family)